MRVIAMAGLIALGIMTSAANASDKVSTTEKIMLQATMQQSIARQLVDGKYYYFDANAAKVHTLYPGKTHPMIMRMGEHFILCTNFRADDGKAVNVDFYVARQGDGFVIFDTVVDNRAPIKQLMKAGLVRAAK